LSLHLIRHASAGRRGSGSADLERPLDERGRAQAEAMAEALASEGIIAVYSSPAKRCLETVEPLAECLGLEAQVHEELAEGTSGHRVLATLRRLAAAEVSAALCSHGDVIPAVVGELSAQGVPMAGNGSSKGSVWTLAVEGGAIIEGRYREFPG
jgi:8-oxo-dGTP diphosphatase